MHSVASETKRAKRTIPVDELEARGLISADDAEERRKGIARAENQAGLLEDAQENAVTLRAHLNAAVVNLQAAQAWEEAISGPENTVRDRYEAVAKDLRVMLTALENMEERLEDLGALVTAGGAS